MQAFRFGMSTCGAQGLTDGDFENFARAGVKELELSFSTDKYDCLEWIEIKRKAEEHQIRLWSLHLPFYPFDRINIGSSNESVRNYTLRYHGELIKKAADIGIKTVVIHPSGEPLSEEERAESMKKAREALAQMAETAAIYDVIVAVENLPRTCLGRDSKEIKQLISGDDRLKVCFDTNHLLKQSIKEFILDVGDQIVTTHFSDYDRIDERHWLPGEGVIDWKEVIESLEQVGYKGPIIYELGFCPPKTINRRMLTCEDFRENHNSLRNKRPLTAIGTPVV